MSGRDGANATVLRRWKGRRLEPGRYRLTATPAAAGGRGATTTFRLKAGGRRR